MHTKTNMPGAARHVRLVPPLPSGARHDAAVRRAREARMLLEQRRAERFAHLKRSYD